MLLYKQKKNQVAKGKRFLISVTVLGSAGPIRFVVNEEELVAAVIDTALKSYAREGRLPILGSDLNDFLLYCRNAASDGSVFVICVDLIAAISPWETIGSLGARNFMLCKKPQHLKEADDGRSTAAFVPKGGSGSWKAWINKSLNLKIPSLDIIYSHQITFRMPGRVFLTEGLVHIQRYVSDSKVLREREAECSFARNRQMLNYFDSMGSYGPVWRKDVMVIKNRPKVSLSNKLKSRFTTKKWE
ncbi:hypothetical protein POTOM_030009 [Populus tomentosa]|uniref:DUF7054 domain-containing protein n=1 Tax=Populus tomentosa TaxID=118781 RepID=A0A8X7ZE71_POPTO|nr:hypothetical protein POTOM_030009 [Populus tomentosa]